MAEVDRILEELAYISERLGETASAEERTRLAERRRQLHDAARSLGPEPTREQLEAELAQLVEAWDGLARRRIDVVKQAGGSLGGDFGATAAAVELNRQIDEASGLSDLEQRIRDLRRKLAG